MRLIPHLVTALALLPAALAVDQKKSAIVWFDDASTPDSIVEQAKDSIIKAGGKITHVYSIIRYVDLEVVDMHMPVADRNLEALLLLHQKRPSKLYRLGVASMRSGSKKMKWYQPYEM